MKAFDKWFKTVEETYPYWPDEAATLAWKAALEWVQDINSDESYNVVDQAIWEELNGST